MSIGPLKLISALILLGALPALAAEIPLAERKTGTENKSCADCHGDAASSMKGVAARYPAFNEARGRPVNLDQQINICRKDRQKAPPLAFESKELLALSAHVTRQSHDMPIAPPNDERIKPSVEAG